VNAPPGKSAPRSGKDGAQFKLDGAEFRATRLPLQMLVGWFGEAERIAREYRRTGKETHLKAFCRHVSATLENVARSLP